jgi:hypothetical protein
MFGDTAAASNNKLDTLPHGTFRGSRYCIIGRSQIAIATWATTLSPSYCSIVLTTDHDALKKTVGLTD